MITSSTLIRSIAKIMTREKNIIDSDNKKIINHNNK